ncbi:hypothetical protein KKG45_12640 [bacterium]|nr:hypothetical protein [bacterium]MBU1074086.1 hypothetical protein [bacterium]MBU1676947.1 hypothetical protein [bacterium]
MFQWFFRGNEYLAWPLVGLVTFIIAFLAVLFYVFVLLRNDDNVGRMASLPLEDEADAAPAEEGVRE